MALSAVASLVTAGAAFPGGLGDAARHGSQAATVTSERAAPPRAARRVRSAERRLRALETRVLGPGHAAEHASLRVATRRQARSGSSGTAASAGAQSAQISAPPGSSDIGRWTPKFSIPSVAVHAVMLPTGKVLYFTGPTVGSAHLLDPSTHTTTNVNPPALPGQTNPANIFCAGQSLLPDGRVLIAGGTADSRREGSNTIFTFDPFTETWTRHPDMRHGRWYPSQVLLADGRTVILDGLDERGEPYVNPDIEVFAPATDTVSLASVRGQPDQPPMGGLYPHLFAMPSGRTLVAGPKPQDSWFFRLDDAGALSWQDVANPSTRTWATGMLLPGDSGGSTRVSLIGGTTVDALPDTGTSTPLATSESFDEANPAAGWQPGPSLNVARAHHNTVLLPDRSMVTVGGGYGILDGNRRTGDLATHRQIELHDPDSDSWRLGPSQEELRTYHSTALLLPDGRVLSAGDDGNGGGASDTAEIYEPPYLFKGERPTIESAPATVDHGATFRVSTPSTDVDRAVLIAPGAVTHSNDMNQRYVPLTLAGSADGSGVDLVAPASPEIAPPGYYMLFLLNDAGVPSVARFVRLRLPLLGYPRPKGAALSTVSLTIAYRPCLVPSGVHRAPLAFGSCKPALPASSYLTVGTADSNGAPTGSSSRASYHVLGGDPAGPAGQADIGISLTATDMRQRSDLRDYTGELQLTNILRITDKNVPGAPGSATVSDTGFPVTVPCSATASTAVGSTCSIATTANAVLPGSIQWGMRSIWQLGRVEVYDGGADGDADTTAGNTLFLTQGVFVP